MGKTLKPESPVKSVGWVNSVGPLTTSPTVEVRRQPQLLAGILILLLVVSLVGGLILNPDVRSIGNSLLNSLAAVAHR